MAPACGGRRSETRLSMPMAFSAAAFALAPSMARASYDYNAALRGMDRAALASRAVLGTAGRGPDTLPGHCVIGWENVLPLRAEAPQRARLCDLVLLAAGRRRVIRSHSAAARGAGAEGRRASKAGRSTASRCSGFRKRSA